MTNVEKVCIGALGGLAAVCVKFLGQDYNTVINLGSELTSKQILNYKIGYGILTPILMFLGSFVAWCSEESKRMKLLALAVAAPAIITTYAGGSKSSGTITFFLNDSSYAYASESVSAGNNDNIRIDNSSKRTAVEILRDGIGTFFGYGNEPKRYWVIVGSFKEKSDAERYVEEIGRENSNIKPWVGAKVPPNEYYPVIIGGYNLLSEARKLKSEVLQLHSINDAYLSSGAKR